MYVLGIDLGTTRCKSILFALSGKIISESYVEYPLIHTPEGFIEQDTEIWWSLTKRVIKETIEKSGVARSEIRALSISSQGIAFVPVDRDGRALCNAISWLDTRAHHQTELIWEKLGEREIFQRTGKRINPAYSLTKIMWLKENRPEIYNNTWKFLMGLEFLTFKLTGQIVTDYSMASGTMAFNIAERQWDKEILQICGIDADKLPIVKCFGTRVGNLLLEVAAETGLSPNTEVVLGAQDQKCAAIGAGISEGICTVSLGTATAIITATDKFVPDKDMRIPCFALDEKKWVSEAVLATSGVCLKWIRDTFFADKSYAQIDDVAEDVPAGSRGVFIYPHFEGAGSPYWKSDERGFIYGISLSTSGDDVLRALYEGIAYQIRVNIEVLEELGTIVREIRVFGGGSRSSTWCRIIADVTGKDVCILYTSETANLGAAVIALKGSGIGGFGESFNENRLVTNVFKPDETVHKVYDVAYRRYIELQNKLIGYL